MHKRLHPEGALYYLSATDIELIKQNTRLEGDRIPSTPEEIVESATNGLGGYMKSNEDSNLIEFFVPKESVPFADITLKHFAGLTEEQKPVHDT